MAQLNIKKSPTVNNFTTSLNGAISDTATTVNLNSVTGLQNAAGILVVDRVDTSGNLTPTKQEWLYFTGVSGLAVTLPNTSDGRGVAGSTAQSHSDGAIVEAVMDVSAWGGLITSYVSQHADAGTHTAITGNTVGLASNASIAGNVFSNTLNTASTASISGKLNISNLNMISAASGYYQTGKPLIRMASSDTLLRLSQVPDKIVATTTTLEDQLIQSGFDSAQLSTTTSVSKQITLPQTFADTTYRIYVTIRGYKATAPVSRTDITGYDDNIIGIQAVTNSTSQFTVYLKPTGSDSAYIGFDWLAIGTKA